MIWINVFFSLSENLEVIRRVTSLLSQSKNMQFCNEQIRTQPLFSPPCASATYGSARMCRRKNDFNREILASNLFNCRKEVINAPPVPSISRCIHIVYRHKNVWEYQWLNFIHNCMSTFLHYVHCKDALLDCSAPGGERCESLTWVDEIILFQTHIKDRYLEHLTWNCPQMNATGPHWWLGNIGTVR